MKKPIELLKVQEEYSIKIQLKISHIPIINFEILWIFMEFQCKYYLGIRKRVSVLKQQQVHNSIYAGIYLDFFISLTKLSN